MFTEKGGSQRDSELTPMPRPVVTALASAAKFVDVLAGYAHGFGGRGGDAISDTEPSGAPVVEPKLMPESAVSGLVTIVDRRAPFSVYPSLTARLSMSRIDIGCPAIALSKAAVIGRACNAAALTLAATARADQS